LKDQLRIIFNLSQLDLKIHESRTSLENIPILREELEKDLEAKRVGVAEKAKVFAELEKAKKDKEREVETMDVRLKDFEGNLSQIKTNKEYQAATKEIADSKKIKKGVEDQILEVMTRLETLKTEIQTLEEPLKSAEAAFEKQNAELDEEEKNLAQAIAKVEEARSGLLKQIDTNLLALYQKVKKMRREVMAFVEGGACQGCNMRVPPQLHIEIQKLKTVHSCPSCHRILYLREWYPEGETLETTTKEVAP